MMNGNWERDCHVLTLVFTIATVLSAFSRYTTVLEEHVASLVPRLYCPAWKRGYMSLGQTRAHTVSGDRQLGPGGRKAWQAAARLGPCRGAQQRGPLQPQTGPPHTPEGPVWGNPCSSAHSKERDSCPRGRQELLQGGRDRVWCMVVTRIHAFKHTYDKHTLRSPLLASPPKQVCSRKCTKGISVLTEHSLHNYTYICHVWLEGTHHVYSS